MRKFWIVIVMIAGVLVACAPTDTGETTGDDDAGDSASDIIDTVPTPTREGDTSADITGDPGSGFGFDSTEAGFSAVYTGADTGEVAGIGIIGCENGVYVIRPYADGFPQISIILAEDTSTGTYTLSDNAGDGSTVTATIFFEDGRVFAAGVTGSLTLEALATAPNQDVRGTFSFSATSGSASMDVAGSFDFVSDADAVYC
ncbi:MAG: hypothetical protein AAFR81_10830 [Chloroflexota bacterium]